MNDEEVFDAENEETPKYAPMNGVYPSQPDEDPLDSIQAEVDAETDAEIAFELEGEELELLIFDGNIWGQETKGKRKYISVDTDDEERTIEVMLDEKEISPKDLIEPLLEANVLFGPFTIAVDEYKDGSKKKFAISQAVVFKGIDLSRTVAEVRLSAARQVYGFLVNSGEAERFSMLGTAKSAEEKRALEHPTFFGLNFGYTAP